MSHLHIPDGVLPPLVWIVGLLLAVLALGVTSRVTARLGPQHIAFQSALGGIMLAVMAIPVPIAAFDYCMTLAGPVGVLLGAASAFQVSFIVTLILALLGQGGFTVVGLNAIVLGAGATVARPIYLATVARLGAGGAMALATACGQLLSSAAWLVVLHLSVQLTPAAAREREVREVVQFFQHGAVLGVLVALLLAAVAVESLLAFGLARMLDRVRPGLLPVPRPAVRPAEAGA